MKYKFKIGQVVFKYDGGEYLRITNRYLYTDGTKMYTLAWTEDNNYDEVDENELQKLYKREQGS